MVSWLVDRTGGAKAAHSSVCSLTFIQKTSHLCCCYIEIFGLVVGGVGISR